MKKFLNKKASFELSSQMVLWFPRIAFLIVFIIVVTAPIGCYSQNKNEQIRKIDQQSLDFAIFDVKNCIEKIGVDPKKLNKCFNKPNIGIKVYDNENIDLIFNENLYQEYEFCQLSKKYICKSEISFIKLNNELKEVTIQVVSTSE